MKEEFFGVCFSDNFHPEPNPSRLNLALLIIMEQKFFCPSFLPKSKNEVLLEELIGRLPRAFFLKIKIFTYLAHNIP